MRFRKTLAFLILARGLVFALPAWAQQKPFTQDQVQGLVRSGLGDESGAKLIEQRGIDFAPTEDFVQSLKAAGASEAFLEALRAARHPQPTGGAPKKPLRQIQILALLAGEVPNHRLTMLIRDRGIDFEPKDDYLEQIRLGGGDQELMVALQTAKVFIPVTIDPAAEARQAEIRRHVAQGAEFLQRQQYAQAEQEYRNALRSDPQNIDVLVSLASVLNWEKKSDEAARAARDAIRLDPNSAEAHGDLGIALAKMGDGDGAIAEYRESLHLNPDNEVAHNNLGWALGNKGDLDGAIAEFQEALRLNPKYDMAHNNIAYLLADRKGDLDGAIYQYREAVSLNPRNDTAHEGLGAALYAKGDLDGAITEEREAVRVNPNYAEAHYILGLALAQKGDRRGALQECRAAYMLDPKNADYKQNYERLLQQVNQ